MLLAQYAQLLPRSACLYITYWFRDITKTSYVNAEDLAQRIFKTVKNFFRSFGVNNIAISSILMKKIVKY